MSKFMFLPVALLVGLILGLAGRCEDVFGPEAAEQLRLDTLEQLRLDRLERQRLKHQEPQLALRRLGETGRQISKADLRRSEVTTR